MATFEKRGKMIRVRVRLGGPGKVERSQTFYTKREATAWAAEIEKKIRTGKSIGGYGRTVADLWARFADLQDTSDWERTRLAFYTQDPVAVVRLEELRPRHLAELRDRRLNEVSGATIRRDFALLSHVFSVAVREWGWLEANPLSSVKRPEDNPSRANRWTQEEIDRVVFASGYRSGHPPQTLLARTGAAFLFAIETAMRGGEICALTREHVHERRAHLPKTKNGDARDVPLSPAAQRVLQDVLRLNLEPVFGMTVAQKSPAFTRLRRFAGIDRDLVFHDARATAIERLSAKLTIYELARMTGHRDLSNLMIYYRKSADEIADRLAGGG